MNSIWDYHKDGVTQSFLREFRKCKLQCNYNYVQGWEPIKQKDYFLFGECGHFVLERAYRLPKPPTIDEITLFINNFAATQDTSRLSPKDIQQRELIYGLVRAILIVYFVKYKKDWKDKHFVKTEIPFKIKFMDTYLCGKVDGIYRTIGDNYYIIDHKFLWNRTNFGDLGATLPFDIQCNFYLFALRRLLEKNIKGIVYNVILKPGQIQKKTESDVDYIQRVMTEYVSDPDKYFRRLRLQVSSPEMDLWKNQQLIPLLKEVKQWYENGCSPEPYNDDALITKYGRCSLFTLITQGITNGYRKRTKPFGEI